jgi:hypothetical protein
VDYVCDVISNLLKDILSAESVFHDYLLSFWGTPLGEFWDLEKLAETCAKMGRYSFFFTSAPLNVPGGVASPPNALAVL